MLTNDTIYRELYRLVRLTTKMDGQIRDLTARLDAVEKGKDAPSGLEQISNWGAAKPATAEGAAADNGAAND